MVACRRGAGRSPINCCPIRTIMQVNVPKLRTAFEAAADKTGVPCNPFYTKMRDAVFNTCLQALGEYDYTGKPWLHIVSAAPGAGKTTLTNAFIAALVETVPGAT
jgi:hypothetical protein